MSMYDWFVQRVLRRPAQPQQSIAAGSPTFSVVTDDERAFGRVDYHAVERVERPDEARGDFVVFHAPMVKPTSDALGQIAAAIQGLPDADFVFGDEQGPGGDKWHKPGWSPALLLAQPYAASLFAVRRELLAATGGVRPEFGDARCYDLALRTTAAARRVVHLPHILSHTSRAPATSDLHLQAASHAAAACGLTATVARCDLAPVQRVSVRPRQRQPITVIIPTRDRVDLLGPCVESVLRTTQEHQVRILIVDNGSVDPTTLAQFDIWHRNPRIQILRDDAPFDYAALMNRAVASTATPLVLLLNNDTKVVSNDWLDELAGWLDLPDVGAVGAKLYYANDTIQHAGVLIGVGGVAGHGHKNFARSAPGYHGLLHSVRDTSAVTGACLLTRRELYLSVGGLEPELRIAYNDVDYCLKLRARGQRILWTPLAELYHFEGKSRGIDKLKQGRFAREIAFFRQRWGETLPADPFYNPNLSTSHLDYRLG